MQEENYTVYFEMFAVKSYIFLKMTPDLKKKRTLMMVVGTAVTLASNSATYKKKIQNDRYIGSICCVIYNQ